MADEVISRITLPDGTTHLLKDSNAARSNHTHTTSLAEDSTGTSSVSLKAGTKYKLTSGGTSYTFTTPADANDKVTQTATTTSANYEILFSGTADNTNHTEGARKTSTLTYNPSTKDLSTGGKINGYTLAAASARSVDNEIGNASTSTNLPTSKAVAAFVEGKGYVTSSGVTQVGTGVGLTGGPIATTGTIKANLTSDDKLANAAVDGTETAGRVYPVRLDKDGKLAVNVPWTDTNTHHQAKLIVGATSTATANAAVAASTNSIYANVIENSSVRSSNNIAGSGSVTVSSDANGKITITGTKSGTVTSITPGNGLLNGTGTSAITTSGTLNINYGTSVSNVNGNGSAAGTANTVSRSDHTHKIEIDEGTNNGEISIAGVTVKPKGIAALAYKDSLLATDIPNLAWSKITSGKPTTLSGYGITDAKIDAGVITLGSNTIKPVTSVNGHSGSSVNVTAGDLGLSSALRYIGKTTSTMSESFTGVPAGISGYTKPIVGDVVLDSAGNGEYVCVGVSGSTYTWESLGSESSFKKIQTAVSSPSAGNSAQIEFIDTISQDVQGVISVTKQPVRVATTSQTGVIQITRANANSFLNSLDTGSSTPVDNDYYISQYVGGGTTTTTYHRRPVSALYSYIKSKTDTLYPTKAGGGATGTWEISISGNAATATTATKFASAQSITLTGDTTGTKSSQAGWSIPTVTSKMSGLGRKSTVESIAINQTTDIGGKLAWNIYDSSARNADAENTPSFDASVINIPWDWGAYNGQIAISSTSNVAPRMQIRTANHKDNGSEANPRYTPLYTAWREIVTAPKDSAVGSATQPVYINNTGQVVPGTALGTAAYKATGDFATSGHNHDSTYLKLSGGTLTGAINTANGTWNKIGDDAQLGDINRAGHIGIQGINGNTGIFFVTYNQSSKTTGGAITWDGTKFSITSTAAIDGTITNSTWATLLKPIASTTTAGASTWNIPSGSYQVWGEKFTDTRLKYTPSGGSEATVTDSGDWTVWLTSGGTTNTATLNMRIDGTYYGSFSGNLTGTATTATTATNLSTKPTLAASGNNITVTAGGKTSDTFTVPYATSAGSAGTATTATSANRLSQTTITSLSSFTHATDLIYAAVSGSNSVADKPSGVDAFGVLSYKTANGWFGQLLMSSDMSSNLYWRTNTSLSGGWRTLLDTSNYTTTLDSTYVKKANGVTAVTWDATNKKLTRTINGTAADVMTAAQMSTALGLGTIASKTENSYMKFGGDDTNLGNSSPADTAKTYWADTTKVSDNMITGYYNHSGTEYSLLFSKRSTYGSILKWGYGDKYLRILRIQSGTWKSTDWEKIDAGYADSAGIANKLGTADKGSGTKPIYLADGVATECSTYAGGTAVTLNGTSKAASTASFYAPTSAGSNTQALVGGAPTWTNISPSISIGAGTGSAAPTVNVSVLGQSGTAQSITTANTAVYGVTKLQDGVSSDSTVLAATAKAAKTASTSATHTLATTTKFFVTGCTSSTTNTAGDDFDTGVYVTTTAGEFSAVRHSYNVAGVERAYTHYNMTDQSIDFVFV